MDFIELRKNTGMEEFRTRDLFLAAWVSDIFMDRVQNGGQWSFFDPNVARGLDDVHGTAYKDLYESYEARGLAVKTVPAQKVWTELMLCIMETGMPYVLQKDSANAKSNQQNLGTIKSSNLCSEIIEYSSPEESAVCTLASIVLPRFVRDDGTVDYQGLCDVAGEATKNLDKIVDGSFYPTDCAKRSNFRHRPLGLGVSGLADVFFKLKIPFGSPESRDVNRRIFESIYRGAILASIELAKEHGPYETFQDSPASKGLLQFDLWTDFDKSTLMWDDWGEIKGRVITHGLRNSLNIALMPTASSASIMGVCEAFEPQTSNMYMRKVLSGEFSIVNRYLVKELEELGLWNDELAKTVLGNDGSIQSIEGIPQDIKDRYRTVWEMKMRPIIDMAADRGPFVCQSQSMNLFVRKPSVSLLTSMYMHAWKRGLKTLSYYLRTRAATEAVKFTVENKKTVVCDDEVCLACES